MWATTLGCGMLAIMVAALVAYCIRLTQPTHPSSLTRAATSVDEAVVERTEAGHEREDTHRARIETHTAEADGSVVRHPEVLPVCTREGAQAAVLAVLRQAAELRRRGVGQLTALDEVTSQSSVQLLSRLTEPTPSTTPSTRRRRRGRGRATRTPSSPTPTRRKTLLELLVEQQRMMVDKHGWAQRQSNCLLAPLLETRLQESCSVVTYAAAAASTHNEDCPVCLSGFTAGARVLVLPCRHGGCVPCMRMWISTQNAVECPLCRAISQASW